MAGTPGPNNAMLAASGASFGFRRTVPHMLGIAVGLAGLLIVAAFGAAAFLQQTPWLERVLHWVASAYMLWLAWKIATARPELTAQVGAGRPLTFTQAALFQWVNPKAWAAALGAIIAYANDSGSALMWQAAVIALVFLVVTFPVTAFWTAVGVGVGQILRDPVKLRAFNIVMAALLVLSVLLTQSEWRSR